MAPTQGFGGGCGHLRDAIRMRTGSLNRCRNVSLLHCVGPFLLLMTKTGLDAVDEA
jgi:hypothetical protein